MTKIRKAVIRIFNLLCEISRIVKIRICYHLRIMTSKQTITYILKYKCSVSRFGDGELNQILVQNDIGFQKYNPILSNRLEKVLEESNPKLLKCVPRNCNSLIGCTKQARRFWLNWGQNGYHEKVVDYLRKKTGRHYLFGDTQLSRPYMDYQSIKRASKIFSLLKEIWLNEDILIVEGVQTKLGVGNDLFDEAKSIIRILVPSQNAFNCYESILKSIISFCDNRIVILAVGPTATVLAADLCNQGIQAIDIGHVDIEYEWFRKKAKSKIAIVGKYTNEAINGDCVDCACEDEKYLKQIVFRII